MGYDKQYGAATQEVVQRMTMNRVYGWMTLALLVSAVSAYVTATSPAIMSLVFGNKIGFFALVIAELALVFYLSARIQKLSFSAASLLMGLYSVLNGALLSSIFYVYSMTVIQTAFLSTALTFGVMSAYGYFTKSDLSRLGSYLLMGLIGLIIASVVNIFVGGTVMSTIITYLGLVIFIGLTAYDTQKIKNTLALQDELGMQIDVRKVGLMGALELYLDFVNMFLYILRLLGNRD